MLDPKTTTRLLARLPGFRGTRLGEPYVYRWVDLEPTQRTWNELAERQGCALAAVAMPLAAGMGYLGGGEFGFSLGLLFSFWALPIMRSFGWGLAPRRDQEPVPKAVRREAYIEYAEDDFHFVLEVNGKAEIWQPWSLVRRFEKTAYWPMFGDAGESPFKTGWHAIAMTPDTGKPWMIGSTIEGESEVRARFTELDRRFSEFARADFMRAYEARKKSARSRAETDTDGSDTDVRPRREGVPRKL